MPGVPVSISNRSTSNRATTVRSAVVARATASPPSPELAPGQARRIAISAQQLATPPRSADAPAINRGHLMRLVRSIGLLQIDSVNVLARAHLLPISVGSAPIR